MLNINEIPTLRKYSLDSHKEYDEEPVVYCKHCLSLRIMSIDGIELCDDCGSAEFEQTDIYNWEKLYENMYGHKFVELKEETI